MIKPILPGEVAAAVVDPVAYGHWDPLHEQLAWARANDCHDAIDGLGMLVEQAAESFALWRGVRPDSGAVLADLRRELAARP